MPYDRRQCLPWCLLIHALPRRLTAAANLQILQRVESLVRLARLAGPEHQRAGRDLLDQQAGVQFPVGPDCSYRHHSISGATVRRRSV